MKHRKPGLFRRIATCGIMGLIILCGLTVGASAISNIGLPTQSRVVDRLDDLEKARLSEIIHLRTVIGDAVWPGFSQADIPIIIYNEKYAFLVGLPNPSVGWKKVPVLEQRGGPWEIVPGDSFVGQPYYRTLIIDPQKTPEGFTVLVGDRWVATFQTREYSKIDFYRGFKKDLPPFISNLVPLRLVWSLLMGKTESYIGALEHESFHAYEGILAQEKMADAEQSSSVENTYPFEKIDEPWKQEMDVLYRAAVSNTDAEARDLARKFLGLRTARRSSLTSSQVDYERLREWEEGLAKYVELEICRQADVAEGYKPVDGMSQDPDFKNYDGQEQLWSTQLNEVKYTQGRSGDTRFYYSGNALAIVLDRLLPGWKPRALPGGEYLEELLREAVQ